MLFLPNLQSLDDLCGHAFSLISMAFNLIQSHSSSFSLFCLFDPISDQFYYHVSDLAVADGLNFVLSN